MSVQSLSELMHKAELKSEFLLLLPWPVAEGAALRRYPFPVLHPICRAESEAPSKNFPGRYPQMMAKGPEYSRKPRVVSSSVVQLPSTAFD